MADPSSRSPSPGGGLATAALASAMIVGAVLVFSALTKILAPKAFVAAVEAYGILPSGLLLPATTGVIGMEVGLGLMLLLGPGRRAAAWFSVPLVVLFALLVTRAMQLGLTDCGCFGEVLKIQPRHELIVDLALLALLAIVLRWGSDLRLGSALVGSTLGWIGFAIGGAAFLAAGPVVGGSEELEVTRFDLDLLTQAEPPLEVEDDAFLFFFSADCDHCWSYAASVQMLHDRVEGISVHAVTYSDAMALESFEEAFLPTYPIHIIDEDLFDQVTSTYPAAVWVQAGEVAGSWAGYAPSHRQIAESGGYWYRELEEVPSSSTELPTTSPSDTESVFGGPVRGR